MQAEGARFGLLRRQLRLAVGGELVVVARAGVARGARLRGQARLERRGAELGLARVVVAAHGAEALLARAGLERVHAQVLERQRQLLHLDLADRKWRWIAPARRPETRAPPPAESSGGGGGRTTSRRPRRRGRRCPPWDTRSTACTASSSRTRSRGCRGRARCRGGPRPRPR